jgi:LAGLIDADG DNA endonuclease family
MRKFNISENSKSNARLVFLQSVEQSELIYHLFELFKEYSISPPKINSSLIKETGNLRYNISFGTRTLPCFNEFYNLFYKNRVKVVPDNIEENFTKKKA